MVLTRTFSAPAIKHQVVARSQFSELFEFAIAKPLTVVMAPAGYGKTTACVIALSQIKNLKYAWITMAAPQNDAHQFVQDILNAIDSIPRISLQRGKADLVGSEGVMPMHRMDALLEILEESFESHSTPLALVFDDYQKIDNPEVHALLSYLIDEAPINIRVVLLTRTIPPFKDKYSRISSECTYLNQQHCEFNQEETTEFLKNSMSLNLEEAVFSKIQDRTQGWPLGVQLIGIHLRLSHNSETEWDSIDNISNVTADFFRQNVYEKLSPDLRARLDELCWLHEFSVELIDYLYEKGVGLRFLAELEEQNLFIFKCGGKDGWYKLHDLFRDFICQQSDIKNEAMLLSAARWYVMKKDLYTAIAYFLEADAFEEAANYVEQIGAEVFGRGEIHTLSCWIDGLSDEVRNRRPRILILQSWCVPDAEKQFICPLILNRVEALIAQYETSSIDTLSQKQVGYSAIEVQQIKADYLLIGAHTFIIAGDIEKSKEFGLRALQIVQESKLIGLSRSHLCLGQSYYFLGDHVAALRHLENALQFSKFENNPYILIVSVFYILQIHYYAGNMHLSIDANSEAVSWLHSNGYDHLPMTTLARTMLGETYREKNQLMVVDKMLVEALDYCKVGVPAFQEICVQFGYLRYHLSLKNYEKVLQAINTLDTLSPRISKGKSWTFGAPSTQSLRAALNALTGKLTEARDWLNTESKTLSGNADFMHESERLILARVMLICGELDDALLLCREIRNEAEKNHRLLHVVQSLIIESVILQFKGETESAQDSFKEALIKGINCGLRRTFLDAEQLLGPLLLWAQKNPETQRYAETLLSSKIDFPLDTHQRSEKAKVDKLTRRETSVIILVADGASNKEIARQLNIAPDTANKFVRKILKKLEVRNRTEAAIVYKIALEDS